MKIFVGLLLVALGLFAGFVAGYALLARPLVQQLEAERQARQEQDAEHERQRRAVAGDLREWAASAEVIGSTKSLKVNAPALASQMRALARQLDPPTDE